MTGLGRVRNEVDLCAALVTADQAVTPATAGLWPMGPRK